ncbi:MAG: ThiF family adenylyltransferase, partial [Chloroflexota bacterium]
MTEGTPPGINVKLIGVGGIGTALLPFLARYLHHRRGARSRITLVDGDDFERANETRQEFPRIGNKAVVKAEELAVEFPRVSFRAVAALVSPENVAEVIA